jgi:hypothetical protein
MTKVCCVAAVFDAVALFAVAAMSVSSALRGFAHLLDR